MLQANKLTYCRNEQIIWQNLDFELPPGKLLQVVGTNGSGKTSLLRVLAGLTAPVSGNVSWRGKAIANFLVDYQQQLHYLGHQPAVKNELTAEENLQLTLTQSSSSSQSRSLALKTMGLQEHQAHFGYQLSQGQKQRLALARLLLHSLPLWILDEPLAGLDNQMVESLQNIFAAHIHQGGIVVLSTHRPLTHPELTANLSQISFSTGLHD